MGRNTMSAIVVGTDHSPQARGAVEKAATMAKLLGVPLHIVTAVRKGKVKEYGSGTNDHWNVDRNRRALGDLVVEFQSAVTVTTAVLDTDPASALCKEAIRLHASVIVVGNKRVQGASRVLGSIAGGVTKLAPCDVLVVHTQA
jgi:nucleotide-binding universal stress UspA family protein